MREDTMLAFVELYIFICTLTCLLPKSYVLLIPPKTTVTNILHWILKFINCLSKHQFVVLLVAFHCLLGFIRTTWSAQMFLQACVRFFFTDLIHFHGQYFSFIETKLGANNKDEDSAMMKVAERYRNYSMQFS